MESNYAAKNVSAEQPSPCEKTRISCADGYKKRTSSYQTPSCEGTQTINGSPLLSFSLPKEARLRKRTEFLRVYEHGKRIEGRFMTVFILPNEHHIQRVGITATKKGIGKAHDRNRAKRLLRESFRLSKAELADVPVKYDWVLNARRSILKFKLEKPLNEFRQIVARVALAAEENSLPQETEK